MNPPPVPLWGRFETSFHATTGISPDAELLVDFTGPQGRRQTVRGFWFGSREWRVRFRPTAPGVWTYRTRCTPRTPGLHAQTGDFACTGNALAKNPFHQHGAIKVARNRRHLAHADDTPFFWLGDTVWNGPMMSKSAEDWDRFLAHRQRQHFNTIQFVMTNWRAGATNPSGEVTWVGRDPIWINPHWFEQMDARFDAIEARGMLAAPVLIWTLGKDEVNPSTLPEKEIIKLARYMVARYGAHHVVWILNGDGRYYGPVAEKWRRIGRAVFDLPGRAPVVQHPGGMQWPHDAFEKETWIDLIGYQSGHGDDQETWQWLHSGPPARKWHAYQPRPFINLEPPYEDHICYQSRRRHDSFNIRRSAYWSLLNAPPAGLTYGGHGVWGWEEMRRPPTDHAYTGTAQPWHVAMNLEGSWHMKHLADLFGSLPWTKLVPDQSLVLSAPAAPRKPGKMHVVFSRDADGETAIWVDGVKRNSGWLGGDFSSWVADTHFALGNESTGDYGWRGVFHHAAIYDRALTRGEIAAAHAGRQQALAAPVAEYRFAGGRGTRVRDVSPRGLHLDLVIHTPGQVRWQRDGLAVLGDAEVKSITPAARLAEILRTSQAASFEFTLTPAEWGHRAGGRICSMQVDRWNRNFAITQVATEFTGHIRTSATAGNAEPSLATSVAQTAFDFVAAARTPAGDCAVLYLPAGGSVRVKVSALQRKFRVAWLDPRTGRRRPARTGARGIFTAPDTRDWVLLFQS